MMRKKLIAANWKKGSTLSQENSDEQPTKERANPYALLSDPSDPSPSESSSLQEAVDPEESVSQPQKNSSHRKKNKTPSRNSHHPTHHHHLSTQTHDQNHSSLYSQVSYILQTSLTSFLTFFSPVTESADPNAAFGGDDKSATESADPSDPNAAFANDAKNEGPSTPGQ